MLLLTALPLVFPDGQLPSPRWRWIAWLVVVGAVIATSAQLLVFWPPVDAAASLLGKSDIERVTPGLLGVLYGVGNVLTSILGPLVGATAVIVRLRRSVGVERQQMRWFAYAIAVLVMTLIFDSVIAPELGWTLWLASTLGIILVPVALGVAILRYRLYDIDRIISRTLSYGVMSLLLAFVFVAVIVALTTILESVTGANTVAVAASTLIVAALFQPLRRRIQRVVDRRFDRARYDGQHVVDGFARQLRDEVDLERLRASLARAPPTKPCVRSAHRSGCAPARSRDDGGCDGPTPRPGLDGHDRHVDRALCGPVTGTRLVRLQHSERVHGRPGAGASASTPR